ncbi:G-type lectin S-receptor-like serine/threonine-protein kinase [Camellia lanceoleosa]|uniref:G-type lectin S-receptor-like serine/threonine-protein kinase n=1 Tax=Camellia lanceoleosa TaxID=1840588 RepID=A0ACC0HAZ5_9ERIC|nr:G-type lectin S-receptor-like serine/threonine-protein kinase [Camellia lanceoleosa]
MDLCCRCCTIYYYVTAAAIITFFLSSEPFSNAQPRPNAFALPSPSPPPPPPPLPPVPSPSPTLVTKNASASVVVGSLSPRQSSPFIHREEVMKMMRVAVWCLQSDFSRRPSMSVVVKVLEGSVEVENNLDYNFTTPMVRRAIRVAGNQEDATGAAASPLFPSVLSGPR